LYSKKVIIVPILFSKIQFYYPGKVLINKEKSPEALIPLGISFWSRVRESNPQYETQDN